MHTRLQIFWKADSQGQLIYLAPQWQQRTGRSVAESLGDRFLEVIHPHDLSLAFWLNQQQQPVPQQRALRLRQADGNYVYVIAQAQPITNASGQIIEWLGSFTWDESVQDFNAELEFCISARTAEMKSDLLQVRDYVERVTLALDAGKMGIWDWDLRTDKIVWNFYHEILLGYEPGIADRSYQDWAKRVHTDDLERVETTIQQCMATGNVYSTTYRVIWPDSSLHWLSAFGQFYYDATEKPVRMVGRIMDISDLKWAEQQLQATQEQFGATFEQAAVGLAHLSLDGQWLQVNQRLCEILGYERSELLNHTFHEITHPEDIATDLANREQLLQGQIQTFSVEKRYLRKDGAIVWVNLTVSLLRETQSPKSLGLGMPKYFISVIEDISDRKAAELALQNRSLELSQLNRLLAQMTSMIDKRNQELDQFVYLASHDLKAPLRAIANLAQWIHEDLSGQSTQEVEQQLQLMQSRIRQMENLINGLLEYSRVGRMNMEIEPVVVADLLAEVIDSIAPPASLRIQISSPLPTLQTKRLLLRQVLSNLIGNAIKHHHRPDGQIQISATSVADGYEFSIVDDGPGIAPDDQGRIFGIFQTLDKNKNENTGVGLAIVKKIVESEGGEISVESTLGQGAAFRFTWPNVSFSVC